MNKERYIAPEMEIIEFECEDIIVMSDPLSKPDQPPVVTPIPSMVPFNDPNENNNG